MKELDEISFNAVSCQIELAEFRELLNEKDELAEKEDILPFFQKNKHLSAFLGTYHSQVSVPDRIAHEFSLFGDFSCDLVVGDSRTHAYCLIELEDAKSNSIFTKSGRMSPHWSSRFERGFGQIIDWFYKLADTEKTDEFENKFGARKIDPMGILIIGRSQFLEPREEKRLQWRQKFVLVNSQRVLCLTFDQLLEDLEFRLRRYPQAAAVDENS
jgi:Domain of unknown function (DUF4263)